MADDKDAAFALRVSQKVKDAVGALAALRSIHRRDEEDLPEEIKVPSINEAFRLLIAEGLGNVLNYLEYEIGFWQPLFVHHQTMMEYLITRPDARKISSGDLPEGSPTQVWLAEQVWCNEPNSDEGFPALNRIEVANKYARYQDRLERLTNAKSVVEQASITEPDGEKTRTRIHPHLKAEIEDFETMSRKERAPAGVSRAGQAMLLARLKETDTTAPGYTNRNGQTVVHKTNLDGNDHNQRTYVLRCNRCSHKYGANGSDVFQRRCPSCDGGKPGLPIDAVEAN